MVIIRPRKLRDNPTSQLNVKYQFKAELFPCEEICTIWLNPSRQTSATREPDSQLMGVLSQSLLVHFIKGGLFITGSFYRREGFHTGYTIDLRVQYYLVK